MTEPQWDLYPRRDAVEVAMVATGESAQAAFAAAAAAVVAVKAAADAKGEFPDGLVWGIMLLAAAWVALIVVLAL
jgi:hypothetical protein